jgi:hypothetical protein
MKTVYRDPLCSMNKNADGRPVNITELSNNLAHVNLGPLRTNLESESKEFMQFFCHHTEVTP